MQSEDVLHALLRIENLLEVQVKLLLRPMLDEELKHPNHHKLYEMTGDRGIAEIAKKIGFSTGKISGIWQKWEQMGLVRKVGKGYIKTV